MAKIHTLKERGSGETIYPETTAEAVYFADGRNTLQKADELKGLIESKCDQFSLSEDLSMSEDKVLSVSDEAKRQVFIDMWNARAEGFGRYNGETGFFELNEIHDIPYAEALEIYADSFPSRVGTMAQNFYSHTYPRGRTLFSIKGFGNTIASGLYQYCTRLVHIRVRDGYNNHAVTFRLYDSAFADCKSLKKILGRINVVGSADNAFSGCVALEDIDIAHIGTYEAALNFKDCPRLSYRSLENMVEHTASTASTAIKLHPTAFALLTDELIAAAAEKQITFVTN